MLFTGQQIGGTLTPGKVKNSSDCISLSCVEQLIVEVSFIGVDGQLCLRPLPEQS